MTLLNTVKAKVAAARKALQTASGSVADVRAAVVRLQDERRAVEAAPIPQDEAIPLVDTFVTGALFGLSQFSSVEDIVASAAHGRPIDLRALTADQRVAVLVAALGPVLRVRFREVLADHYGDLAVGLAADDRQARLRAIDAELVALEREEETLIRELAEAGVVVDRRGDASPAVVLGLAE